MMENLSIPMTPWYIVLGVALSPVFALFIADIAGWVLASASWRAVAQLFGVGEWKSTNDDSC